jgi:hypothetical protein
MNTSSVGVLYVGLTGPGAPLRCFVCSLYRLVNSSDRYEGTSRVLYDRYSRGCTTTPIMSSSSSTNRPTINRSFVALSAPRRGNEGTPCLPRGRCQEGLWWIFSPSRSVLSPILLPTRTTSPVLRRSGQEHQSTIRARRKGRSLEARPFLFRGIAPSCL